MYFHHPTNVRRTTLLSVEMVRTAQKPCLRNGREMNLGSNIAYTRNERPLFFVFSARSEASPRKRRLFSCASVCCDKGPPIGGLVGNTAEQSWR